MRNFFKSCNPVSRIESSTSGISWRRGFTTAIYYAVAGLAVLGLTACAPSTKRNAVPETDLSRAHPYGIELPFVRQWGSELSAEEVNAFIARRVDLMQASGRTSKQDKVIQLEELALSGGGPDGAFGAGLLTGWTERGDRPEFDTVTGISTGALIAPFAFLGTEYDYALKEIYTNYSTDDLLESAYFSAVFGGSAATDTKGFRRLIEQYVTPELVEKIAEAHRQGRLLLIGTTNLDASRPVVWNIGEIAASGHPDATNLIRDVMRASASIPAVFPPVLIPVQVGNQTFDELHVDGGATQQVMLYSPEVELKEATRALGVEAIRSDLYAVINNKLSKPYEPVEPTLFPIAGKALSTLISGSGTGDLYKMFAIANRDGINLQVTSIPADFELIPEEPFDPVYMAELFKTGREIGLSGNHWLPHPPDFAVDR